MSPAACWAALAAELDESVTVIAVTFHGATLRELESMRAREIRRWRRRADVVREAMRHVAQGAEPRHPGGR